MIDILKKSKYIILSLVIIVAVFITVKFKTSRDEPSDNLVKKSLNITTSQPVEEYKYILKDFQGKLAVFEKNKKDPEMIFDVLIDSLPEVDVIELQQGLKIKDEQELNERIEDFVS